MYEQVPEAPMSSSSGTTGKRKKKKENSNPKNEIQIINKQKRNKLPDLVTGDRYNCE
jgi:hypothetical protein